ncbi:MAG: hypothetical protein A3F78_03535 [Burkholderiales bacterium RIFCSPLOWO2_12_FULL_61_40]|nr:MAG: hypothetical protein A3F78_03535 [Burkholderiales bacterium RIFCSPLOWO2_12_FULL_61_40]
MAFAIFRGLRFPVVAALVLNATASYAQLDPPALAKLESLRMSPESTGTLVYRGDTFAQHPPFGLPLYRYERRVLRTPTGLTARHITRDPTGRVVIVEASVVSPTYAVQRFEVVNQQAGFAGSAVISQAGHHLDYELNSNGTVSRASEDVSDPVVTGPSLFGFILKNWDTLKAGSTVPVRMVVLKDKTTYGFDLRFEKLVHGQVSFTVTPSSFLVRLAVAPLRVVLDAATRNAVRYEGRVPPMENVSGKLQDLDARVEYTSISPTYR